MVFKVRTSGGSGNSAVTAGRADRGKRIAEAVAESKREIFERFMLDRR